MDEKMELLRWDMYEMTSSSQPLVNNKVRGRLRKFAIENKINLLVENISDTGEGVRFAVLENTDISQIKFFLTDIFDDLEIKLVLKSIINPVLSKIKVNQTERY